MTRSRRRLALLATATTVALTGAAAGPAHAEPPPDAPEQIDNGDFSAGVSPWFSYGTGTLGVTDGRLCTTIPGGLANPWDAGIGQDGVPLVAGAEYTLGFDVSATPGTVPLDGHEHHVPGRQSGEPPADLVGVRRVTQLPHQPGDRRGVLGSGGAYLRRHGVSTVIGVASVGHPTDAPRHLR